jgi:hypothetical protein
LILTLAACSGTSGATDRGRAAPVPTRTVDSVSPIADYLGGEIDGENVTSFVEHQTQECMRKKGWDYQAAIPVKSNEEPRAPTALLQYRQRYGYGLLNIPPTDGTRQLVDRQQKYQDSLPTAERQRYAKDLGGTQDRVDGPSVSTGCRGAAEQAGHKLFPAFDPAITQEADRDLDAMRADPRYVAATTKWSACMAKAGFQFHVLTDGRKAVSDHFFEPPSDELKRFERRVGGADAQCLSKTVWPVQSQLETAIVQRLADKYPRSSSCSPTCQ